MSVKIKIHHVVESKKHEGYGGSTSVMGIWGKRPRDVYPEVSYSSVNDMYNTLLKYGYGDKHPIYYKNNSPEQIKGHILGYFKWTPTNSDADIEADALAAATMIKNNFNKSESKEPTDEKLGYEKGHKNSRGEDAPWVIRSHEDNRILASFAHKKDAEEHMKRMKQYSKSEARKPVGDVELVDRLKKIDPEKGKYIIKAFHDIDGYWVWFPDRDSDTIETYGPGGARTLHEDTLSELIKAYKTQCRIIPQKHEEAEKMDERREDWVPCILVARNPLANNTDYCYNLDGDWTPHEDNAYIFKTEQSAEQTVQKFVDKLQRGHVNGFAAWTTKNISIEPLKDNGSKSEELETYACFIDFETEDDAKQGLEIVKGWNPVRDDTAVVVDGLGEGAANHLWNDWKQKCAKAGLAISDEGEVYKEEPACFYGESKKSEALFNKTEMENVAIKAAVKAAWSAAKVKYFRIDFRNTHPGELNVYPVTSDGKDVGPFWGVSPDKGIVYQYSPAWDDSGNDEVVREMKFKDVDGIEEIFTDEFTAMDDTLEVSIENGGNDITSIDSSDTKDESKKSESLADNPSDIHTQLSNLSKQDKIITFLNDVDGPVIYMDASKGSIPYGDYLLKYLGIDSSAMMVSGATVYNVEDIESYDTLNGLSSSFVDSQKNKGINKVCKITTKYLTKPKKSEDADDVTYELTEDAVTDLIKELGLEIVNTWYDGNKDRIVYDCKDKGDENGETVCVWVEPPYEARVWLKDVNPHVNQLVEDIGTIDALKAALVDIFKIELGESHITESLRKPEDTIIVPNWLWETYTLGENYDGDTLTDDEQQTYFDFKEKYEGFSLKAVSEKTTFRSDNDFDSNGCPCYEVNVFKK